MALHSSVKTGFGELVGGNEKVGHRQDVLPYGGSISNPNLLPLMPISFVRPFTHFGNPLDPAKSCQMLGCAVSPSPAGYTSLMRICCVDDAFNVFSLHVNDVLQHQSIHSLSQYESIVCWM